MTSKNGNGESNPHGESNDNGTGESKSNGNGGKTGAMAIAPVLPIARLVA